MRIQSPLSNLSEVLRQVNSSGKLYQETLVKNEAATRAVLIDPILRALGWDTANTHMVEVEKILGQVRADYALYDSNSIVKVIIEAKALNSNLNQPGIVMSLVNYAFTFGLQDILLTDGLIWHRYTNFEPGNVVTDKTLDLAHDDPVECAAYLVQWLDAAKFWSYEQSIDILAQQVGQLESTVATLQQDLAQIQKAGVPKIAPSVPLNNSVSSPNSLASTEFVELTHLKAPLKQKPVVLRLPNGNELRISAWKDVLRECCKFTLDTNPKIPIPFPDRAKRKVFLFNTVPPPKGISYVTEQYNGTTIYIYVNYDAQNCVSNAIYVLNQVPAAQFPYKTAVAFG
jgi:predicted type IV restriction endonuclease